MNECCKVKDNLVVEHPAPDKTIAVCQVCGRRHFRMKAEPGRLTGAIKPLSAKRASGFSTKPQWVRHRVSQGKCVRCGKAFSGEGAVCTRPDMTFQGDQPNAKDCQP